MYDNVGSSNPFPFSRVHTFQECVPNSQFVFTSMCVEHQGLVGHSLKPCANLYLLFLLLSCLVQALDLTIVATAADALASDMSPLTDTKSI